MRAVSSAVPVDESALLSLLQGVGAGWSLWQLYLARRHGWTLLGGFGTRA